MRIAVIGTGYVGLVTGACLAHQGHVVTCVDTDAEKLARLRQGVCPLYEPGLDAMVSRGLKANRLHFVGDTAVAVAEAEVVFICVGTPTQAAGGEADLGQVRTAAVEIAAALRRFTVVAVKSTVPVGTGDEVEALIRRRRPDADVAVVSNPEFLREGTAVGDCQKPDRIIVGTGDARARDVMARLYAPLTSTGAPLVVTDRRSAELVKYTANALLAIKIAFINEIADLSEAVGADVEDVAHGVGLDPRIGPGALRPGPGYGGSCFPKDSAALLTTSQRAGAALRILAAAVEANTRRKQGLVDRIARAAGGLTHKTVTLLGLTFKADTDDLREAASLTLAPALLKAGAAVRAYDPKGMAEARRLLPGVEMCTDPYAACWGSDLAVVLTEWPQFAALDLARLRKTMRSPALVDLRNLIDPATAVRSGFSYAGIGRHLPAELEKARAETGRGIVPMATTGAPV
jgi:UDPglucose 6-dehydrogenase